MVALTNKFDNNLINANFCNFSDNIPQILRVKASLSIKTEELMYNVFHH